MEIVGKSREIAEISLLDNLLCILLNKDVSMFVQLGLLCFKRVENPPKYKMIPHIAMQWIFNSHQFSRW